jgi:hypothetical protein
LEEKKVTCVDCPNRLSDHKAFYIMGWIRPGPDVTLDDELEYNEDLGPFCEVCFKWRMLQAKQPSGVVHTK